IQSNINLTGTGTLLKTGSALLIFGLSAVNWQFSAGALFDIEGGSVTGGNNNADTWTRNQSDLFIASGASFNGVEANIVINALNGSGTLISGLGNNPTVTIGVAGGSGNFSGVLANNGGNPLTLVKTGTGTQTLSGLNTYTGGTQVNGGVLRLGSANAATGL